MSEFDNALILTSPWTTQPRVKDAQWLLAGHNRFAKSGDPIHPYKGQIDGIFGPKSTTASREAKIWLGYPDDELYPSFGQNLYGYLHDIVLPHDYAERRIVRLKQSKQSVGQKALEVARTQLGTKDGGDDNTKYGVWYGFNFVAWCDIFISWCFHEVGNGYRYSYVPQTVHDARYNMNNLTLVTSPKPGDLMCYYTPQGMDMHIGFYDEKIDSEMFWDIAGNAGPIADGVYRGRQSMRSVSHIVRVRW
jgi:hypothetical protein